jgi:hypothetical protein
MRKQLLNLKQLLRGIVLTVGALLLAAGAAHADIWGFVDDKGVAHFASEKIDERYELYFKNGQNFDTQEGVPSPADLF